MLLRPGKTYDDAIKLLDDIALGGLNDVDNSIPLIGTTSFSQLITPAVLAYERWTESAQRQLRAIFADGAVVDRVRADKYWIIVSSAPSVRTASMMHTELSELRSYFRDVSNEMRARKDRYSQGPWIVVDTNDLLHYYRLDTIPWSQLYGRNIRLAIPHVVIDEIDSKSYQAGPTIQKRARGVYRLLETFLDQIEAKGSVTLGDGTVIELLADEIGEARLPNNDDEIVARAAALQQVVSPECVTMVTRDIGMRARALAQRLKVAKIPDKYLIREEKLSAADMDDALSSISPSGD